MSKGARKKELHINMVSESVYGFQGQGVHTAFLNFVQMLKDRPGLRVSINSRERCDILHAHTLGPLYWTLMRRYPGRRVMSAHVVPASVEGSLWGWRLWGPAFQRYMVAAYNSAEAVVAVAPAVKRTLAAIGVTSRQVVITNPVDLASFRPDPGLRAKGRRKLGLDRGAKMALCVGQIQPRKGVEDFIEAARATPKVHFVWVGGRPFSVLTEAYLELDRRIKKAPKNVSFVGLKELEEMPAIYNAADLFFFPSYQENCALAIGEAAACGLPLLLRDLADYHELYPGAFMGAEDQAGFQDRIADLATSSTLRQKWRRKSLALAEAFDPKALADKLEAVYRGMKHAGN